jgi:RNA polymerase sigma factor (sigma-70 family)
MDTDLELIARILAGDEASLDILARKYLPIAYARVRGMVCWDDVDDVVQDILLQLISSVKKFDRKSSFATFFNGILLNRVSDYHRRNFRYYNRFVFELPEQSYEDDHVFVVRDLLMRTPKSYREVLMMYFCDGLSLEDIADMQNIPYERLRSRYRRAIQYVKAHICV